MPITIERTALVPPSHKIFEDEQFRRWVSEVGLVVPVPDLETAGLRVRAGVSLSSTEQRFFDRFNSEPGFILPRMAFADYDLSGGNNGWLYCDGYVKTVISRLRAKLENPNLLNSVHGLGYGIGIRDHVFRPTEVVRLIYCVWSNFGFEEEIPSRELADMLYGNHGNLRGESTDYLKLYVYRFNKARLAETKVKIARFPETKYGYLALTRAC